MEWAWLISGLTAISLLLGIANLIWSWMSKGGARLAAKLDKVDACTDEHERRIQSIEGELKHMPSRQDVAALELQLNTVQGQVQSIDREVASVARTARRIEEHLLGMKA